MATWPSMLPGASDPSGYGFSPEPANVRTQMDVGPARVRRRTSAPPTSVDVQFIFTEEEMEVFEAWFKYELADGAAWFSAPYYNGTGLNTVEARFMGDEEPYKARTIAPRQFSVTARWEVRNAPLMSEVQYGILMGLPLKPDFDNRFDGAGAALNPRWAFSRGTPTRYIDAAGLLRVAAEDQPVIEFGRLRINAAQDAILWPTNAADSSRWVKQSMNVEAINVVLPSGAAGDAFKLVPQDVGGDKYMYFQGADIGNLVPGQTYWLSLILAADEWQYANIWSGLGASTLDGVSDGLLHLQTGDFTLSGSARDADVRVRTLVGGWVLVQLRYIAGAGTTTVNFPVIQPVSNTEFAQPADGVSGIRFFHAGLVSSVAPPPVIFAADDVETVEADTCYIDTDQLPAVFTPGGGSIVWEFDRAELLGQHAIGFQGASFLTDRIGIVSREANGSPVCRVEAVAGGASLASIDLGALAVGTHRIAMSWTPSRLAVSLDGAAVQSADISGLLPAVTRFGGVRQSVQGSISCERHRRITIFRRALQDVELLNVAGPSPNRLD